MRLREDAEEMLKAIEDSSGGLNDAYDKLKAGYSRLWKLGALRGCDELRICLFRLILCSFKPLSAVQLACILQNWIGSDRLYSRRLVEEIESLYSNFLVGDVVSQDLRFTHNSAREFVIKEILAKISGGSQEFLASSIMKENHRSTAQLFVNFIQRFDSRDRREVLEAFDLLYFRLFGLDHCRSAEERPSIFAGIWSDMIQRALLPQESRLADVILALDLRVNNNSLPTYWLCIYEDSEGKSHLLLSHFLVLLNIIHDDDLARLRRMDLRAAPSDTGTPEGMLRHFAEQAVLQSIEGKVTALHIACYNRNVAAVEMVLESTYYLFGKDACTDLLFSDAAIFRLAGTPFIMSLHGHCHDPKATDILVMETLLRFESRYLDTAGDKEKALPNQESYRAQQWSNMYRYWNALAYAMLNGKEETVCHLLKIAGPVAINELDENGYTPVMAATSWGRLKLMRTLVEDCHADLSVKGLGGKTVLDIARRRYPHEAEYLEQRMSISELGESVDSSSKVNENTS